jgi:predicted dehydrogenase
VSKIAEFLKSSSPRVLAYGYTSAFLQNLNETEILDELRAIIYGDCSTTAYFTFTTQFSPAVHQLRVYGPKNSLIVDDLHQTVIKITGNYKSYLNHFIPPLVDAKQYLANSIKNVKRFIKRESYFEEGRKHLIEKFYRSVSNGGPVPIPYREILLTSKIMDDIFKQLNSQDQKVNLPGSGSCDA